MLSDLRTLEMVFFLDFNGAFSGKDSRRFSHDPTRADTTSLLTWIGFPKPTVGSDLECWTLVRSRCTWWSCRWNTRTLVLQPPWLYHNPQISNLFSDPPPSFSCFSCTLRIIKAQQSNPPSPASYPPPTCGAVLVPRGHAQMKTAIEIDGFFALRWNCATRAPKKWADTACH